MRILLVNYEYPPLGGGGGIAMMEIARELARKHEVHVLTSGTRGLPRIAREADRDLTVHRVQVPGRKDRATASFVSMAGFLPAGARYGRKLSRELQFDVVNTWFAIPSGIVGGAVAPAAGCPHVLTVIGGDIYDPSKWYSPHSFAPSGKAVAWALKRASAFVAISSDIAARTRTHFGLESPIDVIPLGIAAPTFAPASREQLGLSASKKYIAAIGRLVRRKDYPSLLRAVSLIDDPNVELLILGDGPERDNLLALAAELGIKSRVRLLGFVDEELKYQILSNSDVFALVSLHEGFGVVYLEAMYCGLPVIAASEGGQIDLLEDNVTGRLVEIGNSQQISSALKEYLYDSEKARQASSMNVDRFEKFSIENLALQYERKFISAT